MRHFLAAALALLSCSAAAHAAVLPEQGSFVLHKFAKAIGKETYAISATQHGFVLKSDFDFKDRGTDVPLTTQFVAADLLHPLSLRLKGKSSRLSPLDARFTVDGARHRITFQRDGKTSAFPLTDTTFLVDGYSPVAMQQMLMRFWLARGKPQTIAIVPDGQVHVQALGDLVVDLKGQRTSLHGYLLSGLIWGVEVLWMDDRQQLVALVSTDAEFDHFEAVRDRYETALPVFIQAAARHSLTVLGALTTRAKQPASARLAITDVTLIDGTGKPARRATVFVEHGTITRIGAPDERPDRGGTVIDGKGKFLIPGLWDMHAHYEQVEWGPIYLAAGVTTVRDCGNEFDFITTVRDTIDAGRGIGPRILIAGIVDGVGPKTLGAVTAQTPAEAIAFVRRYKKAGAVQIKIYSSMSEKLVPVITAEAHRLGMTVTGHIPFGMTTGQAIRDGYDAVNHITYLATDLLHIKSGPAAKDQPLPRADFATPDAKALLALLKQHHTVIDDTTELFEIFSHPASQPLDAIEPGIDHVAGPLRAALNFPGVPADQAARATGMFKLLMATLRTLHEQGVPIVAGTDQAIPGYSLHRELELYVQAGFTPMEALQAATSLPAKVLGKSATLGTIEPGKQADMVLLDADPLADIHNTRRIGKTIAGGAVYDPAPLWQAVDFKP